MGTRAAIDAQLLKKPIRWFSVPQLFRYERQQKGRLREHFQLNVDIVGEQDVSADAELLAVAVECMRAFGLGPADVRARVSDRRLLMAILRALELRVAAYPFKHGAIYDLPNGVMLADSYHCSRYNTNTGRLTTEMFESVFAAVRARLA